MREKKTKTRTAAFFAAGAVTVTAGMDSLIELPLSRGLKEMQAIIALDCEYNPAKLTKMYETTWRKCGELNFPIHHD